VSPWLDTCTVKAGMLANAARLVGLLFGIILLIELGGAWSCHARRRKLRNRVHERRVAPAASPIARILGCIRRDPSALERLVQRRRAARVGLARSGRARLAPLPGRPYFAVVRRGEEEVFRQLEDYFRPNPNVTVIWDRRIGDQPVAEAASHDRRTTPTAAWQDAAYILVPKTPTGMIRDPRRSLVLARLLGSRERPRPLRT
jgi:hypothetical protein